MKPKMSGYIKTFKVKDGHNDKNNKLMSYRLDNKKLLQKYKAIWIKIKELKSTMLNALPIYQNRYIKSKIRANGGKVYTNLRFECVRI